VLELRDIGMQFGGTPALSNVSVSVFPGEILAIIGENGAGKSTLLKIAAGLYPHGRFSGQVLMEGVEQEFANAHDARRKGLVLIPQELLIAPDLPIAENMFAGDLPGKSGRIAFRKLYEDAREWLRFFDIHVDPRRPAVELSPAEQRLAVIAAALSRSAKVLILDEPTAALSDREASHLFDHLRRLSAHGVPSIFISHRLGEVMDLCHRITVLRNGEHVTTVETSEASIPQLVRAMIGHDIEPVQASGKRVDAEASTVLDVSGLTLGDPLVPTKERVSDVSLSVKSGEILGLFGLVGSGRTEIAESLFGSWLGTTSGDIKLQGESYIPKNPQSAVKRGIAMLTEDRKQTGIFPDHNIGANLSAASLQLARAGSRGGARREARRNSDLLTRLDIRPRRLDMPIESLSGGNQQKVLLGRWLACNPKLLILDEPTVGVDIGAREEIYGKVRELTATGVAVLVISSDVTEIQALCDRVIIMRKGRIAASFAGMPESNQLLEPALGGSNEPHK
jgi:ABC-type sugar transport system ATPase subunit